MIRKILFLLLALQPVLIFADEQLTYDGFLDTYYAYDPGQNGTRLRDYTTQAYYNEEPAINLFSLGVKYNQENYRAKISMQAGSSVDANYSAEETENIKYIQEANVGIKLSEKLWFDTGIYFSHIGLESWASKDNWAYTRSLVSEYTPYYQAGGKLTYDLGGSDFIGLHLLNGWQNITSNRELAFGLQYYNQINDLLSFTYSNFIGDEEGERIFNDFVLKVKTSDFLEFATVVDIGHQDQLEGDSWWYGLSLLSKFTFNQDLSLTLRLERFSDPDQVLVSSVSDESFKVWGTSANIDYQIYPNLFWRNEAKLMFGGNSVFKDNDNFDQNNLLLITSLSYWFNESRDLWN